MFDIGFFEVILVSVVALLVLGPEKLPGAVRTAGLWIGRLKRSFNNIKTDIEKEIGADEIRRQLRNEAIMEKFDSTKNQFTKTIDSVKSQTDAVKKELDLSDQLSAVAGLKPGTKSSKESAAAKESSADSASSIESTKPKVESKPKVKSKPKVNPEPTSEDSTKTNSDTKSSEQ